MYYTCAFETFDFSRLLLFDQAISKNTGTAGLQDQLTSSILLHKKKAISMALSLSLMTCTAQYWQDLTGQEPYEDLFDKWRRSSSLYRSANNQSTESHVCHSCSIWLFSH